VCAIPSPRLGAVADAHQEPSDSDFIKVDDGSLPILASDIQRNVGILPCRWHEHRIAAGTAQADMHDRMGDPSHDFGHEKLSEIAHPDVANGDDQS
jgi:hypothetical protein